MATDLRGIVVADPNVVEPGDACPPPKTGLADVSATVLLAGALLALLPTGLPNYDGFYALVWGAELVGGQLPSYDGPVASAPHPLAIAVAALAAPFGDAAAGAYRLVAVLAAAALCVGLYRLGRELIGWPVGLLAAALMATRAPFLESVTRASFDMVAVALMVWALVAEVRRPRRGRAVLVLLLLAGLLRPEAWLYAGVYWLWLAFGRLPGRGPGAGSTAKSYVGLPGRGEWPRLARLLVLVLAAPLLWTATDALVTGDPSWTRHQTERVVALRDLPAGLGTLPGELARHLGGILWYVALLAAVLGVVLAVARMRARFAAPLAVAVLTALSVIALSVNGLPVLQRFLFLPAALGCLFAAVAALGWTAAERRDPLRAPWRGAGLAILLALAVSVPFDAARIADMRGRTQAEDAVHGELLDLADRATVRQALASCRRVYVPTGQPVPSLALRTGVDPRRFSADLAKADRGALVAPRGEAATALLLGRPGELESAAPEGHRAVARSRSWAITSGCAGS